MRHVLVGTSQKLHKRVDNILKSPVNPVNRTLGQQKNAVA